MHQGEMQAQVSGWARIKPYLYRDEYTIVGCLLFVVTVLLRWRGDVGVHEAIYLLGSRRVADPEFLANDLTWAVLPPTTFLHDHMLAPLWGFMSDFGIVNLGRFATWFLTAWSLTLLARIMRLPPWSVVVGYAAWILAGQTLTRCGPPLVGFQPKSFSYPLLYFALAFVMRGQAIRAGLAAGLATAFHLIGGGWGCLALFLSMVIDRRAFTWRQVGLFLLGTAPFILPLVLAGTLFFAAGATPAEQSLAGEIFVVFAWPDCADPSYFLKPEMTIQIVAVFLLVPLLLRMWPLEGPKRTPIHFTSMLILFFLLGILARPFEAYWFLKFLPFRVGNTIPLLFLFWMAAALCSAHRPRLGWKKVVWIGALVVSLWKLDTEDALEDLHEIPAGQLQALVEWDPCSYDGKVSSADREFYTWIRENTPVQAVFITPYIPEFWTYAERAQVASFRHCPFDSRLVEWKARIDALNGFRSYEGAGRGFKIVDELSENESNLAVEELLSMHEKFGAAYYITEGPRPDLADHLLSSSRKYHLYDLTALAAERSEVQPETE